MSKELLQLHAYVQNVVSFFYYIPSQISHRCHLDSEKTSNFKK